MDSGDSDWYKTNRETHNKPPLLAHRHVDRNNAIAWMLSLQASRDPLFEGLLFERIYVISELPFPPCLGGTGVNMHPVAVQPYPVAVGIQPAQVAMYGLWSYSAPV